MYIKKIVLICLLVMPLFAQMEPSSFEDAEFVKLNKPRTSILKTMFALSTQNIISQLSSIKEDLSQLSSEPGSHIRKEDVKLRNELSTQLMLSRSKLALLVQFGGLLVPLRSRINTPNYEIKLIDQIAFMDIFLKQASLYVHETNNRFYINEKPHAKAFARNFYLLSMCKDYSMLRKIMYKKIQGNLIHFKVLLYLATRDLNKRINKSMQKIHEWENKNQA